MPPSPVQRDAADALAALFARQPDRTVPDLDRIRLLVELLGRPDRSYPSVSVTGTNGKTSTAHMIAALLGSLGLTAGTYTSPHLQDIRERIRVQGEPIAAADVIAGLEYLQPFLTEVDARSAQLVTFFEVLTALAFTHFADVPVDAAVLEVGMGGRWDATNVADAQVAVITSVALDHPELGATPAQVAAEKAGVITEGAMVVSAEQDAAVAEVIAAAAQRASARVVRAGPDFAVESRGLAVGGQYLELRGVATSVDEVFLPLYGAHQAVNAACALAAVEGFFAFERSLDPDLVREAFADVRSPGRLEVVARAGAAPVVLDAAHNPAGAEALARTLRGEFAYRHRVLVVGVLGDKDVDGMAAALAGVADHAVVCPAPSLRAAAPDRVAAALADVGVSVEPAGDVAEAVELATGLAGPEDAVVVTGSLTTVGAARSALGLAPS